jgi:hypothetical protein
LPSSSSEQSEERSDVTNFNEVSIDSKGPSNANTEKFLTSTTTNFPVLEVPAPYNILRQPTTSFPKPSEASEVASSESESGRKHRVLTLPQSMSNIENDHSTNDMESPQQPEDIEVVLLDSHKDEDQSESPRQINSFNINSGYFIPSLTQQGSDSEAGSSSNVIDTHDLSWQYQPQDPENTYHPNLDKFLKPPAEATNEADEIDPRVNPSTSAVWVPTQSKLKPEVNKSISAKQQNELPPHPFSGFNSVIKLQSAESQDHGTNKEYEFNSQSSQDSLQDHKAHHITEDDFSYGYNNRVRRPNSNPNYNYVESTIHHEPPQHRYKVTSSDPQYQLDLDQHHHSYQGPSSSSVKNEDAKSQHQQLPLSLNYQHHQNPNGDSHSQVVWQSEKKPPSSAVTSFDSGGFHHPESSPGGSYQYIGENWGQNDYNNNNNYGLWDKAKAYFYKKGDKSIAEKVFEISIAVLSFLAFGGYLLMLIYQVIMVTSAFPLFPVLSAATPQNPTLLGLLLGRGMSSDSEYRVAFPGEKDTKSYINELEAVVKKAMSRVKDSLESYGGSGRTLKGDLGH